MAQLQISLSRGHKLAERLKQRATEQSNEAVKLSQAVTLRGVGGAAHIEKLAAQGELALAALVSADRYLGALAKLRTRIGAENDVRGVSRMLAELDALNRRIGTLKSMLNHGRGGDVSPQALADYKPLSGGDSVFGNNGVSVAILNAEQLATLEKSLAELQRAAFALSDQIAEANAGRFAVELDDDIAAEITGA